MNATEYTYLLNKPDAINDNQLIDLDKILVEFSYFQSARSLQLKGLYKQDSFKYNHALKNTAAYTTDRAILFDFITSENFTGIQKDYFEEKKSEVLDIDVVDSTVISEVKTENTLEQSIISSIKEANQDNIEEAQEKTIEVITIEEKLEIGKPLEFNTKETHSFQEWLQLAKTKPIEREENPEKEKKLASKLEIIDKFIEANPKIPQVGKETKDDKIPVISIKTEDTSYLMTETLAKVYLEQKKYNKAIQAYEILILKYPEKITFFADRISDIKKLQQNNNN